MTTIATIVGARPQFIKAAVVALALQKAGVAETIVHTGQHFDPNMSDVFFSELGIPRPAYNLGIGGGTHGQNTGRMIEAVEAVLLESKPDWVLVYGDTDSTLAGALAAAKLHIPVGHVEAGLRSFNRKMPEEINRVLTDHVSTVLFAPTEVAIRNLAKEGVMGGWVRLVGDVMYDAALHFGARAESESAILDRLGLRPRAYALATIHRAENTDSRERIAAILTGLAESGLEFVLPLHPRTRKRLADFDIRPPGNVTIIDPVGYLDMVMLEKHALLIATDSGGVQKEAFFHRVPCVTLRDETEWTELVDAGWNRLAGGAAVAAAIGEALSATPREITPYGDGNAAILIAETFPGQSSRSARQRTAAGPPRP